MVQNQMNSNENDEESFIDHKMSEQRKIINRNRIKLGRLFGRFASENNKFTITTTNKTISSIIETTKGNDTRMDIIYAYLFESPGITNKEVLSLVKLIKVEQYDTESLFYDVDEDDNEKSNILCSMKSEIFRHTLYRYVKHKIGIIVCYLYAVL